MYRENHIARIAGIVLVASTVTACGGDLTLITETDDTTTTTGLEVATAAAPTAPETDGFDAAEFRRHSDLRVAPDPSFDGAEFRRQLDLRP